MKQIIKHANVFDGLHEQLKEDANIAIEDGKVIEIFQGDFDQDGFEKVLDASGYTVIPGLVDSHFHLCWTAPVAVCATYRNDEFVLRTARYAKEVLGRGITTIREAGGETVGLKNCIDNGFLDGPRIFPCNAMITQTCGHDGSTYLSDMTTSTDSTNPLMRTGMFARADGVEEVLRTVRQQLFLGASQIKLMISGGMGSFFDPLYTLQYTEDEIRAAVQAASDYGTYVMAHAYTAACIERGLKAGVMSFEHATLMSEDNAKEIKEKGAWVCVCPQFIPNGGQKVERSKPYPQLLGTPVRKQKVAISVMQEGLQHQTELINKYDLNFVYGTDQFREEYVDDEPADRQLADLRNFKKSFGSYRGLKSATGSAYELSRLTTFQNPYPDGKIGVLEKGAFADLLFVQGNPVEDLEILCDVNHIKLVMKNGKVYRDSRN